MEFKSIEEELKYCKGLLSEASSLLDDVHCGDTRVCIEIDNYLCGEEE